MIHKGRWKLRDLTRCFRPGRFEETAHHYDSDYAERMDRFALGRCSQSELDHLLEHVALDEGSHVLDLGCNTGRLTEALAQRTGGRVTGIDPNEAAIAKARERFRAGEFQRYDGRLIPFDNEVFDHVMVNADDEKIRANRLALMRRIRDATNIVADFSKIAG